MNCVIEQINSAGRAFIDFAWPMLWQSSILIVILLFLDFLLHKKVRAVFRYWLWMLILIKLVLPVSLWSPVSIGKVIDRPKTALTNIAANRTPVGSDITNIQTVNKPLYNISSSIPVNNTPTVILTWQAVIFILWLVIVITMLLLLIQRAIFVFELVRHASEVNDWMRNMLHLCSKEMGINKKIDLKISPYATSPAVCGLFHPIILIPDELDSNLESSDFKVVLTHELAHIKRGDLWLNLFQILFQIAYFYNPLVWLANWVIRRVREQAVDETVQVALGKNARQYPETLLNVAKLVLQRPIFSLRLTGVVESRNALKGRIKRMLNRPIPKTSKLGLAGFITVCMVGATILPMSEAKNTSSESDTQKAVNNETSPIDLIDRYPTTLTEGNTDPKMAREWQFTEQDIFSLSGFSFFVGDVLQVEIGPADLGIGHCVDGAVWAVVIPREKGTIKSLEFDIEPIDHLWLRFHPALVSSLFSKDTVNFGEDINLSGRMNKIARAKICSSWQAGGKAMIPSKKDFTVDADLKSGVRRFFMVDSEAQTAKYVSAFKDQTMQAQSSEGAPTVVNVSPRIYANDIEPSLNIISVEFDKLMLDKSWSWTGSGELMPKSTGRPSYDEEHKICSLPVSLEPGKVYRVGINSPSFGNFKSADGITAKRYMILFATKDKDGNPTPIPQDLLAIAKAINEQK